MEDTLIKFSKRNSQIIDFVGLERDKIRKGIIPTDIDGFIDYGGNAFIYFDAKFGDADVPVGQRKAYENIVKSHRKAGNKATAFIFRHNIPCEESVIAKDGIVDEVYTENGWTRFESEITVKDLIQKIEDTWKSKGVRL